MFDFAEFASSSDVLTVGWTLIHFLWQGVLISLTATLLCHLISSASRRYLVCCGALSLMVVCPLLTCFLLSSSPLTLAAGGDIATPESSLAAEGMAGTSVPGLSKELNEFKPAESS